jgi:hypothetical protein
MSNTQPGDLDLLRPEDGNSSKLLNTFTYAISPRPNLPTGPPTVINCPILCTFVSQRVSHQPLIHQRLALIYRQTTPRSCLSSQSTRCPVKPPHSSNRQTNWDIFRLLITERLTLKIPLKTPEDIEDEVKLLNGPVGPPHPTLQPHFTPTATPFHQTTTGRKTTTPQALAAHKNI